MLPLVSVWSDEGLLLQGFSEQQGGTVWGVEVRKEGALWAIFLPLVTLARSGAAFLLNGGGVCVVRLNGGNDEVGKTVKPEKATVGRVHLVPLHASLILP